MAYFFAKIKCANQEKKVRISLKLFADFFKKKYANNFKEV